MSGHAVRAHWEREGLSDAIRQALDASGLDLATLTVEDLAPLDQFHGGGLAFTRRLATLGGLAAGMRVLDVGGGLGGPARTLAVEFGCRVTVVDLAESYVEAGRMLTGLVGLEDRVDFLVGDALRPAVRRRRLRCRLDAEQRDEHRRQGRASTRAFVASCVRAAGS